MSTFSTIDRRGASLILWMLLWVALALVISDLNEIKYLQEVRWPTDVYALARIEGAPIDVAVVGSSRSTFALPPSAMEPCLSRGLGREVRVVNVARVFANLFASDKVMEDLLVGSRAPKVAVVEVAPEMVSAFHYQMASNLGSHADLSDIPDCVREIRDPETAVACFRPLLRGVENLSHQIGSGGHPMDHLRWMALFEDGGQYCFSDPACLARTEAFILEKDGGGRAESRFDRRSRKLLPVITETRYRGFTLGRGLSHRHLHRLLERSRQQGIQVILLNMPVHARYQQEIPPGDYQAFLEYLGEVAQKAGVKFVDANRPEFGSVRENFMDPDHLSPQGAWKLSQDLCAEVGPLLVKR